jgi:hypothetical protein
MFKYSGAVLSVLILAIALFAAPASARVGGDLGIGFQIGKPKAALSGKFWTGDINALDMALSFSTDHNWIMLQADYLWHHFNVIPVGAGQLPLYYGIGGTAWVSGDPAIGVQGVVGIAYHFPAAPLDIFLDLSPGVIVIPNPDDNIGVALGMRWYF